LIPFKAKRLLKGRIKLNRLDRPANCRENLSPGRKKRRLLPRCLQGAPHKRAERNHFNLIVATRQLVQCPKKSVIEASKDPRSVSAKP
jgi:hypothetical protein